MMKWVFGADTTPFRKGLDDMRTQTKAFAGSVKGMLAGAIGVGAIVSGLKTVVDYFSRISDLATRFGESAESMQRVGAAAQQAGSDLEGVAKAMTVVTKNANSAATQGGSMGEAFAALGIDASSFVNMPIEEKLLTLAKAMENGKGSGENLALMMQVLGKSGAEMIPLLSQGFEELRTQMEETNVASDATVATLERAGDAFDALSLNAKVAGAEILMAFKMAFEGIGAAIEFLVDQLRISLDNVVPLFTTAAEGIKSGFTLDIDGVKSAYQKYKEIASGAIDETAANADRLGAKLNKVISEKPRKTGGKAVDVEPVMEAIKLEEERKKLAEEIAKLKEEAAMDELSVAEKILELEEKRAKLSEEAQSADKDISLKAQKEMLEGEKELKKLRAEQAKIQETATEKAADLAVKAAKEESKKAEELAALQKDEEKQIRDIKFEGATDEEKVAMLKKEQTELLKKAESTGSEEDKIKLRMEARDKGSEIAGILADKKENVLPTLSTSSLASIGGGGSANILAAGTQKIDRQISLLEVIARNTARAEGGGIKIPDPI